jgi:Fe-S cluster assembly protein SufD
MTVDFVDAALALGAATSPPPWLGDLRARGADAWRGQTLPTRKTETLRYTSLRKLERGDYLQQPDSACANAASSSIYAIPGLDACTIVFTNGHFSPRLSSTAFPEGVELIRFAEANAAESTTIRQYLGTVSRSRDHLFAALNESWLADGLFLRVSKNTRVDVPFHFVWLSETRKVPFSFSQRLLVVMEEGSHAVVVEHFCSDAGQQNCFANGITEIILNADANLTHYRLQLEEAHAIHIGGVHANLGRGAHLDSFHIGMGSTLKRVDAVVNHVGEGAHCRLNGIYLPRLSEHVDYHTCVEHIARGCTTEENFRGIVSGNARAVFNGRILIHKDAQKSAARLSNKNLLTSPGAEVDTKPELEIYADDVQCAHGATVARLDENARHYLLSRGIDPADAEVLLSFGFINELVDQLGHEALRNYLRPAIRGLFERGSQSVAATA